MLQVAVSGAPGRDEILFHKSYLFVCMRQYLRYSPSNMYYQIPGEFRVDRENTRPLDVLSLFVLL